MHWQRVFLACISCLTAGWKPPNVQNVNGSSRPSQWFEWVCETSNQPPVLLVQLVLQKLGLIPSLVGHNQAKFTNGFSLLLSNLRFRGRVLRIFSCLLSKLENQHHRPYHVKMFVHDLVAVNFCILNLP
ncbi:hypothetical protein VNO77_18797 [Canavalia gladiata]|uniref:Secreted protein n=1 Tax=Canavalia gladiata TaxID=3824 RepID=A0AAN9QI00_CANGL